MLSWIVKHATNSCLCCEYYEKQEVVSSRMVEEPSGKKHIVPERFIDVCRYNTYMEAKRRTRRGATKAEINKLFRDSIYDTPLAVLTPCEKFKF